MALFFTSDTHFGHAGALHLYERPFGSVAEMDEGLIERWNAAVGPADEIWHLGDFALRKSPAETEELLARLRGTKHLVVGNNDPPATTGLPGWASVQPYAELVVEGTIVVLCHYAFRTWRAMSKGSLNLHGHSHGRLTPLPRQFDVGVDVWNYEPVTLARILRATRRGRRSGTEPPVDRESRRQA